MSANLMEKNILITGATDGIGKQGAKELAAMGANLILVGRSEERCRQAVDEVAAFSQNNRVDYLVADLSSMSQVAGLAAAVQARFTYLDVLLNNAGAGFVGRVETVEGFERTFALNHLAYFLLTNLLLDLLKATPDSRIVSTSSGSHLRGKIHFDDPHLKRGYFVLKAYAQSKLANVMFTYALSRQLAGKRVTANCFHPGLVNTGIFRKVPFVGGVVDWVLSPRAISVEEGAETMVYLAASEEIADTSGVYFYQKKAQVTNPVSYDLDAQERLWEMSAEMVRPWLPG
ncbi:MAG: SDR family oxidoreductase [Anaerolineales bacterium]|nr:SDR family oxidoreductase [Anaerolineales bacterium]